MKKHYDYVIIGAGPAGLAAAARAASHGLSVALLDEQELPGGQIYRAIDSASRERRVILGSDYARGKSLVKRFRNVAVDYVSGTTVWNVTPDRSIFFIREGRAACVHARRLLIATGAMERPVPIPGWTLPGVMTAGAVDVLFKSTGMIPGGRVVLAGTGPLLYLVTCHLLECGVDVAALLDTRSLVDYIRAAPLIPGALPGFKYLVKGLWMHLRIIQSRVPHIRNLSGLRAIGGERLQGVEIATGGSKRTIAAELLIVHDGVVPNTQMTRLLGCEHTWDATQRYWRPEIDAWGNSSLPDIAVAGDTGGIYGARCAEISGELAAIDTACRLNFITVMQREKMAEPLRKQLRRERAARPFLDSLFTPSAEFYRPPHDDTLVCRCEEITAGQIRRTAAQSGLSPNAVKAKLRCGMGPCQGRLCGLTVAEIIADANHERTQDAGCYRVRPPLKPIPLSALAEMETDESGW